MTQADQVLNNIETVTLIGPLGSRVIEAKIDTGAYRSSFDTKLAQELGLLATDNIVMYKKVSNSLGETTRPVVRAQIIIGSKQIDTEIGVMDRNNLRYRAIIGRKDLAGFLVQPDPNLTY